MSAAGQMDFKQSPNEVLASGEYPLTRRDLSEIAAMIYSDAGIYLNDTKASLVYSRLSKHIRTLGLSGFREYCELVASPAGAAPRREMLSHLTTNFTRFFRENHHFDHLRETLVKFGMVLSAKITSAKVILAQRTVIGASERIPELGSRFYERGPKRGHDKVVIFLREAVERGLLEIEDVELAAYQFTELCLSGLFRQCIFAYRTKAPTQAEIEHVVRSGVNVFLKAYGTDKLAAEEQAAQST